MVTLLLWALSGCATLVSSTTEQMADNLAKAILAQDDPETVREGAPAYLLLIDGLIESDPNSPKLLMTGSRLYASYASTFVNDPDRASRLTDKALSYGAQALCQTRPAGCDVYKLPYAAYVDFLDTTDSSDVPALYTLGVAWATWVQAHRNDWNAVAEVPKVEATLRRVVELDETHDAGAAHIYLGALAIIMPPAMGGRPDQARRHFERAIELSKGNNLMVKVAFAEYYARTMFDRNLHDRLLRDVLAANPNAPELTLINVMAKEKARSLLETGDEYF